MNVLMAIMAVIAAACAIWGSVLGCKVTCCAKEMTGVCLLTLCFYCRIYDNSLVEECDVVMTCASFAYA